MFQQGLIDSPPESLGKRLSAIQASLQDDQKVEKKDDMLEYRAVVKGNVTPIKSFDRCSLYICNR